MNNWSACYSSFRKVQSYDSTCVKSVLLNVAFWVAVFGAMYYGTR